jgi:uncharacterized LabA/DUF88 family protein
MTSEDRYQFQRVGVFVDIQNMYYSAKNLYNANVDFGKVLEAAVGNRELIRAFAYVIKADIKEEASFFEALEKRGFEIRAKDLQVFFGGVKKGDWDVGIAMDIMRMASKLDVVVLVSGDGDFTELLKHAKALGCKAEVMAFMESSSIHLREACDKFYDLSKHPEFLIRKRRKVSSRAGSNGIETPVSTPQT